MGEQNRRATELEPPPGDADSDTKRTQPSAPPTQDDRGARSLGTAADERQTSKMAPAGASPGEGAEDDSIG